MQKKIIALAIAAAFAAPVAMADVTVYGSMDGGFRHQTNDSATQGTTDSMQMGQYNSTRFGLKSVEDMGDGMKTTVVLEGTPFNSVVAARANNPVQNQSTGAVTTDGYAIFDRQATIGVSAGWGTVELGWNYTASFKVIKTYDPFDYKYLAIAMAKTSNYQDRAGSVAYNNKFGDMTVIAEYYMPNATKVSQPTTGAGRALGVTYAAGAVNVGVAYTAVEASAGVADNALTNLTAGAGFSYGDGKVSVGYAKETQKNGTAADKEETNMWAGVSHKLSDKMAVTAAYYSRTQNPTLATSGFETTSKVLMAGVTYDLSKKTQLYVEADKTTGNAGGGAADTITNGVSAGISTAF